jgi:hypothetical protein
VQEPIFKSIFQDSWNDLPLVMKKHYANRAYSNDEVIIEGYLDVYCRWFLKPLFWLFGTVPPYNKKNTPVTIHFKSESNSRAFCFDRIFFFSIDKPFHFRSKMFQFQNNEVIEVMNYGICWHSLYSWNGTKVELKHKGYSFKLFGFYIPLPITWIIGAGNSQEFPIDDYSFRVHATINHHIFGKFYEYKGEFKFTKEL